MARWFYLNGVFVQEDQAVVPLTQTGIQRGYGIFDLFRTVNGIPRFLEDYLDRFEHSQKFLNLSRLIERDEIKTAVAELQERNQFKHSTFKLVLLGDGPDATDTFFQPYFYIVNTAINPSTFPSKMGVITHEFLREYPEIKSLNYFTSYTLHGQKMAAKSGEVIYHKNGKISEASRSNVFAVKDGTLITPAVNILNGITRMHVIKVAKEIMPVTIGELTLSDLLEADELFLTSTLKEVTSISFVNEKQFPAPGTFTAKIKQAFCEYAESQISE